MIKIDGISYTFPKHFELIHDEDGDLFVLEDDGEMFPLDYYMVRSQSW